MHSIVLRETDTYPDYMLIIKTNEFGDQVLHIRYENRQGMQKYVWTEINHEGRWRSIDEAFVNRLKALIMLDHAKVVERWG